MAQIQGKTDEKIYRILEWKGLNENPDGDSKLALGESPVMRNWKVTKDGNLQRRPGLSRKVFLGQYGSGYTLSFGEPEIARRDVARFPSTLKMYQIVGFDQFGNFKMSGEEGFVTPGNFFNYRYYYWYQNKDFVWQLDRVNYDNETDEYIWMMRRVGIMSLHADGTDNVSALWSGNVAGHEVMMAVYYGELYQIHNGVEFIKTKIGRVSPGGTEGETCHLFGYSEKLYILNGHQYMVWDGETLSEVEGYIPLVSVSIAGTAGGTLLEQVNKLTGKRRVWISPDGTATTFALPEKSLASIDYVKDRATGETVAPEDYTVDAETGTVTFNTAPVAAVNSYEIGYTHPNTVRDMVSGMKYSELFNGANDNRVFLYGDGTNQAIYSGLDYDGNPRADYFPDMNVLVVGESNTPITGMIRHYSRLMVYKTGSAYSVQYSVETLADGTVTPAYYITPVNREIGNAAPGQVCLVDNTPLTLHEKGLYEWKNTSAYSGNISIDERQAKRISDRITATLSGFDFPECYCFDDNTNQEYYICFDKKALVYNYAVDAWYLYTNFPVCCMCSFQGDLYVGDRLGFVNLLTYESRTDNGEVISCYWESGSMAFDREWMRKYSAMLWVGVKPEGKGQVTVTVQTDKKSVYSEKLVVSSLMTFASADFRHWSFNTNRMPHEKREKIKAKKFVYYKLLFELESADKTATILNSDIRVRYTGYAR